MLTYLPTLTVHPTPPTKVDSFPHWSLSLSLSKLWSNVVIICFYLRDSYCLLRRENFTRWKYQIQVLLNMEKRARACFSYLSRVGYLQNMLIWCNWKFKLNCVSLQKIIKLAGKIHTIDRFCRTLWVEYRIRESS